MFFSRRQKFVRLSKAIETGLIFSLRGIINEFTFAQAESPIKECLKTIFTQRRKLGVVRKKEKKYSFGDVQEITININIIKGRNIPLRESSYNTVRSIANKKKDLNYKMAFGGGYGASGFNMSGFGGGFNNAGFTQGNFNNMQNPPGTGMNSNPLPPMSRFMRDDNVRMNSNPLPPMSRFMRDDNLRMIQSAAQNSNNLFFLVLGFFF